MPRCVKKCSEPPFTEGEHLPVGEFPYQYRIAVEGPVDGSESNPYKQELDALKSELRALCDTMGS